MRTLVLILSFAATVSLFTLIANPQARPVPPGVREADRKANTPLDPPRAWNRNLPDAGQLKQEADELAKLAAAIPGQVNHVTQGQFPKDLGDQLKRIEKLAKHLRTEISQ